MKEIIIACRNFMSRLFNLHEDKADEAKIIESIKKNVSFRGTNLWTLIFAIVIASIGLNVNSTAVIIGAMLISPLMGPIMGIGLSIGIYDFDLLKRGIKNLLIAAIISIITSWLYFLLTPLHEANSELLARTNPSLWDVFIAFSGGLVGIVAGTRKEKSNVIPGVAIATALMPPLCTAGFGLATGQWFYFLGAIYLFFINSLFICLATLLIVRYLHFKKIEFPSADRQKQVARYIFIIITITILPSIYLTWRIVQRTIFEENAKSFLKNEFRFSQTQIVDKNFHFDKKSHAIELLLLGQDLPPATIDTLNKHLALYNLKGTDLIIRQGLNVKQKIDLAQVKASILEDVFSGKSTKADSIEKEVNKLNKPLPVLNAELKSLFPKMTYYTLSQSIVNSLDTVKNDTLTLFIASFQKRLPAPKRKKLESWLKARITADTVKLIIE